MKQVLLEVIGNPRNQLVLGCFGFFMGLIVIFAILYWNQYRRNAKSFYFPQDPVFNTRLENQSDLLRIKIFSIKERIKFVQALCTFVTDHDIQCQDAIKAGEIRLPDGRCFVFERHVYPEDPITYGGIPGTSANLTVLGDSGEKLTSTWLDRGIPNDVDGFLSALARYITDWQEQQQKLEQMFGLVINGQVIWTFTDFFYFSSLTQATLGCNEIIPNSKAIRRLILFQMFFAYLTLVVLINIAIS